MTIRKLLPPIHIHPILLIFMVISFFTGTFVELFIILAIVLIHELGHYIAAALFKWRIRKVMLWIFGGVMDTDEHGTRPLKEEFFVTIAGPLQHFVIYGMVLIGSALAFVPATMVEKILFYNTIILVFNLLPIWPLDGGKLLFFLLSIKLPFRKAYHIMIMLSIVLTLVVILLQFVFYSFTLSAFLLMIFLLLENRSEWKKKHYVFIRFLLNRYKGEQWIKDVRPITVPAQYSLMDVFIQFKRDYKHPIYVQMPNNTRLYIDEADCLQSYFYDKNYDLTIGEIAMFHAS
ncbi:M50 family metallopeptidase [Ornithinibacillus bavariensis]|uniref:Stage IV sporulation protein FB n=1 Tax=Ornithinibacillus bavariensis TaxID=545502 RepID=A0A920C8I0_9BACI|nr:M50 family metallopeptidase [Ornithinibacillus bavariensis]GIO27672.1 stage IV sporulation protein FB [Ornithinibacillus bavariensis]